MANRPLKNIKRSVDTISNNKRKDITNIERSTLENMLNEEETAQVIEEHKTANEEVAN